MEKTSSDYIHLIPACGYIFGYTATQSTQCSCVAVVRQQGGDGGFLPSPQPDRGTANKGRKEP